MLEDLQRYPVHAETGVASERLEAVPRRPERVEEGDRQSHAVPAAKGEHLPCDEVEEGQIAAGGSSDLARSSPIDVPRPPFSLMIAVVGERTAGERLRHRLVAQRRHAVGGDVRLGDDPVVARDEGLVLVAEGIDRRLVDPLSSHRVDEPRHIGGHHGLERAR